MNPIWYVVAGGAVGSAVCASTYRWPSSTSRVLAGNAVVCGLLGAFSATGAQSAGLTALLGYGVLSTAAPLTSVLLPLPAAHAASDLWALTRRAATALAMNGVVGAAFATAGYLAVEIGITIYQKLTWY